MLFPISDDLDVFGYPKRSALSHSSGLAVGIWRSNAKCPQEMI